MRCCASTAALFASSSCARDRSASSATRAAHSSLSRCSCSRHAASAAACAASDASRSRASSWYCAVRSVSAFSRRLFSRSVPVASSSLKYSTSCRVSSSSVRRRCASDAFSMAAACSSSTWRLSRMPSSVRPRHRSPSDTVSDCSSLRRAASVASSCFSAAQRSVDSRSLAACARSSASMACMYLSLSWRILLSSDPLRRRALAWSSMRSQFSFRMLYCAATLSRSCSTCFRASLLSSSTACSRSISSFASWRARRSASRSSFCFSKPSRSTVKCSLKIWHSWHVDILLFPSSSSMSFARTERGRALSRSRCAHPPPLRLRCVCAMPRLGFFLLWCDGGRSPRTSMKYRYCSFY
eukprot:Rhum_TRINITY_DN5384_c0_g1::Rhum_TRINITY_DN5384_c0_g1_i1::g.17268::m.17268